MRGLLYLLAKLLLIETSFSFMEVIDLVLLYETVVIIELIYGFAEQIFEFMTDKSFSRLATSDTLKF